MPQEDQGGCSGQTDWRTGTGYHDYISAHVVVFAVFRDPDRRAVFWEITAAGGLYLCKVRKGGIFSTACGQCFESDYRVGMHELFQGKQCVEINSDSNVIMHFYNDCLQCHEDAYLHSVLLSDFFADIGALGAGFANRSLYRRNYQYFSGSLSAFPLQCGCGGNIVPGVIFILSPKSTWTMRLTGL